MRRLVWPWSQRGRRAGALQPQQVGSTSRFDDSRLEQRPTPRGLLVVGGSIAGLVVVVIGVSALVKVDQLVRASGKLEPVRSTQDINAAEAGVVTDVMVREGQIVPAGAPLVMLDPRILEGRQAALGIQQQQIAEITAQELARLDSALGEARATQVGLEQQLAILQQQSRQMERLAASGAVSRFQVLDYQKQVSERQAQLQANLEQQTKLKAESNQKRAELSRQQADTRANQLETQTRLGRITLRAPVKGTVLNLMAKTGTVVTEAGEPLLQLVPADNLQAKVFVPNRDLAFVFPGQEAEVSVEAYDRSRYGDLPARVTLIGTDALPPDDLYNFSRFPITLQLANQTLQRDGQSFPLQAGMAIQADLKLEKRTLMELFLSRILTSTRALQRMR
jgi:hemolysin D